MFTPAAGSFDKDQILNFLFYHMTQETRQTLIDELPGAYQRVCGGEPFLTVMRNRELNALREKAAASFPDARLARIRNGEAAA